MRTFAIDAATSAWSRSEPLSATRCSDENCQLSGECTPEGGPCFTARHIGCEVCIFVQYSRSAQPAQHLHHQQVTGAERTVEPLGITKATGKFAQTVTDTTLDNRQALLVPSLVALQERDDCAIDDRRLNRAERGEHPCDSASPSVRIVWQQTRMAFRDMKH